MAWWDKIGQGKSVDKATSALPQTASKNLFTVSGGRIILTQLIGEVTAQIGAFANSTHIRHTPAGGAAADLCAAGTDVNNDAVGVYYGMTGVVTDAMLKGVGIVAGQTMPLILAAGTISVRCLGNDGGGGSVKWTIKYIPLDEAAVVIAA